MFLCVIFYILSLCNRMSAQQADHWHRVGQRAMPSQQINAIAQDQDGYLWIGTDGGLLRYDGHDFVIYSSGNDNSQGLRGNIIEQVIVDADNTVWLAVKGRGLQRYNRISHQFEAIEYISGPFSHISQLMEKGDDLWVTIVDENVVVLNRHDLTMNKWSLSEFGIISHHPISTNQLIASTQGAGAHLVSLENTRQQARRIRFNSPDESLSESYTFTHFCSVDDNIFAGGWDNAIHEINVDEATVNSYVFPGSRQVQFSVDETRVLDFCNNKIWVGTKDRKLFVFDPNTKQYTQLYADGIDEGQFTCLYQAGDGHIWLGTDNGLYVFKEKNPAIEICNFPSIHINTHEIIDDQIYLGTNQGLYTFQFFGQRLDTCINNRPVFSMEKWTGDRIIVGTDHTLLNYSTTMAKTSPLLTGEFIEPHADYLDPRDIAFSRYNDILISDTMIYASAYGHAIVYCTTDQRYFGYYKQLDNLKEHLVNKLYAANSNGLFLLGNDFGLHTDVYETYNECEGDETFYGQSHREKANWNFINLRAKESFNMATHSALQTNTFYDVEEVSPAVYYAASHDGLYQINLDAHNVHRIDVPLARIEGICLDKEGRLWGVENGGLFCWNKKDSLFRRFDHTDGLPERQLHGDISIDDDGQLYVCTHESIILCSPDQLLSQSMTSRDIRFTSIHLLNSNKMIEPDSFVSIHERDNSFSMTFSSFPFGVERGVNYQYRLSDDNVWIENGGNNELIISNLSPGEYQFVVRALDKNGALLTNECRMKVEVRPFWYRSLVFLLFSLLSLLTGLFFFVRFILNQQKKVVRLRDDIARDLHDDIGSTLGSISIFSVAAKQRMEKGQHEEAQKIIDKIGDNSRSMIEKMSDIVWSVNTGNETNQDLINKMEEFARNVFSSQDISFASSTIHLSSVHKIDMFRRKNLYLIFKEMVHNIIKHADANRVELAIREDKKHTIVSLSDDGHGFDITKTSRGNGLHNMKRRADALKAELTIDSVVGEGTKITLLF